MNGKFAFLLIVYTSAPAWSASSNIYDLTLEELSSVSVNSVSSLTQTKNNIQPANITHLNNQTIEQSGAANQIDLLNAFVPEMQVVSTKATGHNPAFRGMAPDAPVSNIYLINGRSMKMDFFLGSLVEAYNLIGDINEIEVVHGPGSVVHGPGNISGVISVTTHDALSFQGLELTAKHMFKNKSNIAELKYGHKTSADSGFFIYAGFEDQDGASPDDSPVRYSNSFLAINGEQVIAGEDSLSNISNYQESPDKDYKVYLDYTNDNFKVWYRYTHESERLYIDRTKLSTESPDNVVLIPGISPDFLIENSNSYLFRQHSFEIQNTWFLSDELSLYTTIGGDEAEGKFDFPRPIGLERKLRHYENEINAKALANWNINNHHQLAFGVEVFHHNFDFKRNNAIVSTSTWDVFSYAALFEHQWNISSSWTSFIGARYDKSRYSKDLFSPRIAVIYSQDENKAWKFIANRSVRFPAQLVARLDYKLSNDETEEETVDSFELSFDHKLSSHLNYNIRAYYQELEAIDSIGGLQGNVGDFETYGITFITDYKDENWQFNLSHSFVDLIDARDHLNINLNNISASGQGYKNDLNAWANNNTKINLHYTVDEKWSLNSSLNILWDYPGSEYLAEYNSFHRILGQKSSSIVIDPGYDDAFKTNVELSFGVQYKADNNTRLRLDTYNIVSLIDDKYNRYQDRNFGTYRVKPFSVLASIEHKF